MPIGGVEHTVNLFHRIQADNQAGDDRVGQTEFNSELGPGFDLIAKSSL